MSPTPESALILKPGSPKPAGEIGRVIANHLGLHPTDTIARVRYGGGILILRQDTEKVKAVSRGLAAIDVETRAIPPDLLEEVPRGYHSTRLEFLDGAISVRLVSGRELVVLESDLRGIHLRAFARRPEPGTNTPDALSVPILDSTGGAEISPHARSILDWIRDSEKPAPQFILCLYFRDPVGAIRLERETTDYTVLGGEKSAHSLDNFMLLAKLILERYPDLIDREQVSNFLETVDPESILYYKREEAQKFDRWMQAWIRLEDLDESLSPPTEP